MKFGQLIECNMRNIFHQKSYTKYDERIFKIDNKIKIEHITGAIA